MGQHRREATDPERGLLFQGRRPRDDHDRPAALVQAAHQRMVLGGDPGALPLPGAVGAGHLVEQLLAARRVLSPRLEERQGDVTFAHPEQALVLAVPERGEPEPRQRVLVAGLQEVLVEAERAVQAQQDRIGVAQQARDLRGLAVIVQGASSSGLLVLVIPGHAVPPTRSRVGERTLPSPTLGHGG